MKICLLARKRLYSNTRIIRQAKSLLNAGHQVTVVCLEMPCRELRDLAPDAEFIEVDLEPLLPKLLTAYHKIYRAGRYLWKIPEGCGRIFGRMLGISKPAFVALGLKRIHASVSSFNNRATDISIRNFNRAAPPPNNGGKLQRVLRRPFHYLMAAPLAICAFTVLNPRALGRINTAMTEWEIQQLFLSPFVNLSNSYSFARKAKECLNGNQFDVVQAHDSHALVAAQRLAKEYNSVFLYDVLEVSQDRSGPSAANLPWLARWLENRMERKAIKNVDATLCIGPAVAEYTAGFFKLAQTPFLVRNCCLYQEIKPNNDLKESLGLPSEAKLGLVIGAIYRDQGLEQLIDSLPMLSADIHIGAMGPVAQEGFVEMLQERARDKGVGNRFHIIPPSEPADLARFASGADAGIIARQATCLNNLYSLPNKVFEMIMARLPVLCGNLPNIKKIVSEFKIGTSFDEKDPADIAKVINDFFKDPETLSQAKRAVSQAAQTLCWEKEGQRYVEFINRFSNGSTS